MITVKDIRELMSDLSILISYKDKLVIDSCEYDNYKIAQIIPVDQNIICIKII